MKFDPPQIRVGGLSGRVYVITHGKEVETPNGPCIEASRKYDVTDQLAAAAAEKLLNEGVASFLRARIRSSPIRAHPSAAVWSSGAIPEGSHTRSRSVRPSSTAAE